MKIKLRWTFHSKYEDMEDGTTRTATIHKSSKQHFRLKLVSSYPLNNNLIYSMLSPVVLLSPTKYVLKVKEF